MLAQAIPKKVGQNLTTTAISSAGSITGNYLQQPGGSFPLTGWSGLSYYAGNYQVNLAPTTSVLEPASMVDVLGLGGLGVTSPSERKLAKTIQV